MECARQARNGQQARLAAPLLKHADLALGHPCEAAERLLRESSSQTLPLQSPREADKLWMRVRGVSSHFRHLENTSNGAFKLWSDRIMCCLRLAAGRRVLG